MNQTFLFVILLIGIGYLFKKFHILKEQDGEVISRIVFNITLPALIIVSLSSVEIEAKLIMIPFIVIFFGLITTLVAFFLFKNEKKELKGSMMMLSTGYNVGLFAFPLVEAIWGAEGLLYFGMFDVGNSFLVFGLSYILGSYYSKEGLSLKPREILRKFSKSIPLMTYIIMSILNFSNIHLPNFFIDVASILSQANMPLSLILLGIYLNFTLEKGSARPTVKYLLYRYGTGLIGGLLFFLFVPVDDMFKFTILIGFLLPIGLSVIPYAHEFNYSTTRLIGNISNLCIVISMIILYILANFIL
ncbi:AEC family transporter [Bacillus sp. B15-48]|uniref:AEC family transporter n=1 Tax=Bacillus sp. B15-48 TaxID=1548601 RepID=UPI00193EF020|nr:AEC family transporter [Bacillus sp. B15-48]MBM4763393.1 AEC family transporter [Bacillus sp. B15-48]